LLCSCRNLIVDISTQASLWRETDKELSPIEMEMAHKLAEQEQERLMDDPAKQPEPATIPESEQKSTINAETQETTLVESAPSTTI
jgi:hypothetical protein